MSHFKSWTSYFDFREIVLRKSRFIYDIDCLSFLKAVVDTGQKRRFDLKKEQSLWRAQLGYDETKGHSPAGLRHPFGPERMKPLRDRAREGRANPKGIPFLYLATHEDVAMAEVRPWIGSDISLGHFLTTRDLCLVDCSQDVCDMTIWYADEPPEDEKEKIVWCYINAAFSEPVTHADSTADYVPTQIIAEQLRMSGYDGIQYRSALGKKGLNVVLFDLQDAEQVCGELRTVEGVCFKFGSGINKYSLR